MASIKSSRGKTFNSFSGVDITPVFQGKAIGSIQAISYSINREKAAIYTMGKASPRAFARGKRAIAGSLIFILFDKNPLIDHFQTAKFSKDKNEGLFADKNNQGGAGAQDLANTTSGASQDFYNQEIAGVWYVDQIPPFDVVIAAANEYGARSYMKIVGVELLNENSGFSIDDIVVEQQYTYIATDIESWRADGDQAVDKVKLG